MKTKIVGTMETGLTEADKVFELLSKENPVMGLTISEKGEYVLCNFEMGYYDLAESAVLNTFRDNNAKDVAFKLAKTSMIGSKRYSQDTISGIISKIPRNDDYIMMGTNPLKRLTTDRDLVDDFITDLTVDAILTLTGRKTYVFLNPKTKDFEFLLDYSKRFKLS